jgi:hypothetical protein
MSQAEREIQILTKLRHNANVSAQCLTACGLHVGGVWFRAGCIDDDGYCVRNAIHQQRIKIMMQPFHPKTA